MMLPRLRLQRLTICLVKGNKEELPHVLQLQMFVLTDRVQGPNRSGLHF